MEEKWGGSVHGARPPANVQRVTSPTPSTLRKTNGIDHLKGEEKTHEKEKGYGEKQPRPHRTQIDKQNGEIWFPARNQNDHIIFNAGFRGKFFYSGKGGKLVT